MLPLVNVGKSDIAYPVVYGHCQTYMMQQLSESTM